MLAWSLGLWNAAWDQTDLDAQSENINLEFGAMEACSVLSFTEVSSVWRSEAKTELTTVLLYYTKDIFAQDVLLEVE
jgi:hypothetical protein